MKQVRRSLVTGVLKAFVLPFFILLSVSANAGLIHTIEFSVSDFPFGPITGTFSGIDENNNGKILADEISHFLIEYDTCSGCPGPEYVISSLDLEPILFQQFGFDITNRTLKFQVKQGAIRFDFNTDRNQIAFYDDYTEGGTLKRECLLNCSLVVSTVPEPSTLAIFALGMIGLASRRFKKQS